MTMLWLIDTQGCLYSSSVGFQILFNKSNFCKNPKTWFPFDLSICTYLFEQIIIFLWLLSLDVQVSSWKNYVCMSYEKQTFKKKIFW